MRNKQLIIILLAINYFYTININAQEKQMAIFGQPSKAEFEMKSYQKDPEAEAVVLFEWGNYYFQLIDNSVKLVKEVYVKTKVFDASKFKNSIVQIPFYKSKSDKEEIVGLKAVTHNGVVSTYVAESQYYEIDNGENAKIKRFTYPNIKDGSIVEYEYKIVSPFYSNLSGWYFQSNIPTLYSELHTELPGNYKYNRSLRGNHPLYINESKLKKACFSIDGYAVPADCDSATYAMVDVPAYKEENYMLGSKTYLSQIIYELTEVVSINGGSTKITESWDDIDKFYKYDKDIGRQIKYESYFEEKIPANILSITDELEKAKAIFYYIQKHFKWNEEYNIWNGVRVKEAFEKGSGNNSDINLSLINALNAAKLDAKMMLISTRENGTPTQEYPVKTDFNFIIANVNINGINYLLDATEKYTSFGVLPFRDLNKTGRLMDFKKGSYWQDIVPFEKNIYYSNVQVTAEKDGTFSGKVSQASTGYIAEKERKRNALLSQGQRNQQKQSRNENIEVTNLAFENENDLELPYKHLYNFTIEPDIVGNQVYLYPFFTDKFIDENPFTANKRTYPIDFGFPFTTTYLVNIDLGETYEVVEVPKNRIVKLPNGDGVLTIAYDVAANKINIRLSAQLSTVFYNIDAYNSLQEYFSTLITVQKDEPIVLRKL